MRTHTRMGLTGMAIAIAASTSPGCLGDASEDDTGGISMELEIAPGVTINTVNWTIDNATTGFTRSGSASVQYSNSIRFQTGGIPAGEGYLITLSAVSVDGAFTCTGSATFDVMTGAMTSVDLTLNCSTTPPGVGTVVVNGSTQVCANLDSVSASPLETSVNKPIALSATASVGSLTPTFAWTATAGTFDDASSATPIFTCPSTPGDVTITVTVSPGAPTCNTVTTQDVVVACDTLDPTFTNVYASVIAARCTGCHKPGSGGVTVGMLDLSAPALAYSNLVGVAGQGVGAGTSGITCASVMPPLIRVLPGDSAGSLLFAKVHSKLVGTLAPCGSPMPLPATATSLTQAEVDLIGAWIDGGALND